MKSEEINDKAENIYFPQTEWKKQHFKRIKRTWISGLRWSTNNFDFSFSIWGVFKEYNKGQWGRARNPTALVEGARMITEYTGHKEENFKNTQSKEFKTTIRAFNYIK